MAESYDRNISLSITDDMIKEALKSGLSSIKASDNLINQTMEKCQLEITEDKKKEKSRTFISIAYKLGAPLAAGALIMVLMFLIPGVFNFKKSSEAIPEKPMSSAVFEAASTESFSNAAPEAPAPACADSGEITITSDFSEGGGSDAEKSAKDVGGAGQLSGGEERSEIDIQFTTKGYFAPQNSNEFSVFLGDNFISLNDMGSDDDLINMLNSVLGEPNSESVRVLDASADTYEGMIVKTLGYDGLTVVISGTETFSVSSIEITHEKYSTYRGITPSMSVDDLKIKYENIAMVLDGRTDPLNCGYLLEKDGHLIRFEVEDGIIIEIRYYSEIG